MRRSIGLMLVLVGTSFAVPAAVSAQQSKGSVLSNRTRQTTTTPRQTVPTTRQTVPSTQKPTTRQTVPAQRNNNSTPAQKPATQQSTTPPSNEDLARAAEASKTATAEEQKILARVRSLQAVMAKEEQLLAQRMAYADKIRQQGLQKNDQKLLDQAEQYERQALLYYQQRVQQFESVNVATGTTKNTTPTRPTQNRSSSNARTRSR